MHMQNRNWTYLLYTNFNYNKNMSLVINDIRILDPKTQLNEFASNTLSRKTINELLKIYLKDSRRKIIANDVYFVKGINEFKNEILLFHLLKEYVR